MGDHSVPYVWALDSWSIRDEEEQKREMPRVNAWEIFMEAVGTEGEEKAWEPRTSM